MSLSPTLDLPRDVDLEAAARVAVRSPWLGAGLTAAAIGLQSVGHVNCDTSWFMSFADKVLDGAVPYVDVADPNPPAAFAVLMPALAIARLLHLHAEAVVVALTILAALVSILLAGRILRRAGLLPAPEATAAFNAAVFATLLAPGLCFAEREHDVLILMLPFLAVRMARVSNASVSPVMAIMAGAAVGLALAFKPYFALPIGAAALSAPIALRRWRPLFKRECLAAGMSAGVCAAASLLYCPAYLPMLHLAADVYGPAHETMTQVLCVPAFLANASLLLALAFVARGGRIDPRVLVAAVTSLGFLATYLIQSKGWMNHAYPGLALALLASFAVLLDRRAAGSERRRRFALFAVLPACLAAPLFLGAMADLADAEDYPGLTAAVARLAPPHPKIAALAQELGVGHPLVRRLGGTWIGRRNCLWISYAARIALADEADASRRASLQTLADDDARDFADDVARGRPDVLLIATPALEAWLRRSPVTAGIAEAYRRAGGAGGVAIWLRRTS